MDGAKHERVSAREKNQNNGKEWCRVNISPGWLYAAAATVWLVLGLATWNLIYFGLAAAFYVIAVRKRKKRDR